MKRIGFCVAVLLLVVLLLLSTLPAQADTIRAITLSQPTGGEKVRAASEYSIRYALSEATTDPPPPIPIPISVRVYFSPNGGGIWQLQGSSTSPTSFAWKVPDISTEQGRIRVVWVNPILDNAPLADDISGDFAVFGGSIPPTPSPVPSDSPEAPTFSDVSQDYWAHEEIEVLAKMGVVNGYPDGTFLPENPVTRAEFAKMVLLSLGLTPKAPSAIRFPDVGKDHWAYLYVEGLASLGLVEGYPDGTFQPEGQVTLAEVVAVVVRAKDWTLQEPASDWQVAELDGIVRPMMVTDWFSLYVGTATAHRLLRPGNDPHILATDLNGRPIFYANTPAIRAQTGVLLLRIQMGGDKS